MASIILNPNDKRVPAEILYRTIMQLDPDSLINLSQTSKYYRDTIRPTKHDFERRLLYLELQPEIGVQGQQHSRVPTICEVIVPLMRRVFDRAFGFLDDCLAGDFEEEFKLLFWYQDLEYDFYMRSKQLLDFVDRDYEDREYALRYFIRNDKYG
ncbi:hypothetical protein QBC35DRAFT_455524, partial [Podospora australis]